MKLNFEKVPLPDINWDAYTEWARVDSQGVWWTCPACNHTGSARLRCRKCGRVRVLLREGDGPRGGERFGWYMQKNWEDHDRTER